MVLEHADFILRMGKEPSKKDSKSKRYKAILTALDSYHKNVKALTDLVDRQDITKTEFEGFKEIIKEEKQKLETALKEYKQKSKSKRRKRNSDDPRIIAVTNLLGQLNTANKKGVNEALNVTRINKLNPLRNDTARDGSLLGVGAQGKVRSKIYTTTNRLGFPQNFEAGTKFDNNVASDPASGIGIPADNPEEAERAVATYETSRLIGLNVIPPTTFMYGKNPKTDEKEIGQAMQRVVGTDGQIKATVNQAMDENDFVRKRVLEIKALVEQGPPQQQLEQSVADFNLAKQQYKQHETEREQHIEKYDTEKVPGQVFERKELVVDIDYRNSIVQKELADLQLLDNIIGHADRHPGNYIFMKDDSNNIIGVRGIDNDDTMGSDWHPSNDPSNIGVSKTPGIPPVVDLDTAIKILQVTPEDLGRTLAGTLSDVDRTAAQQRLADVQNAIKEKVRNGEIATLTSPVSGDDLTTLARLSGVNKNDIGRPVPTWNNDIFNTHTEDNSYLGITKARMVVNGTTPPVFR